MTLSGSRVSRPTIMGHDATKQFLSEINPHNIDVLGATAQVAATLAHPLAGSTGDPLIRTPTLGPIVLTAKQRMAVLLLAMGFSLPKTAARLKVRYKVLQRWLSNQWFSMALDQEQARLHAYLRSHRLHQLTDLGTLLYTYAKRAMRTKNTKDAAVWLREFREYRTAERRELGEDVQRVQAAVAVWAQNGQRSSAPGSGFPPASAGGPPEGAVVTSLIETVLHQPGGASVLQQIDDLALTALHTPEPPPATNGA